MKQLYTACFQGICVLLLLGAVHVRAEEPINIAMTAAFVSENGVNIYEEITDYIERQTGIKSNFVTGLSYSTVNAMIEQGAAQLAFVCGYPYVLSHDGKINPSNYLLVAPVMESELYEGKPIYYSYIIVHKDSTITRFEELKGKAWVYNDKTSNSGYNMPRAKLIQLGETSGFFSEVKHSGSHEASVRMVAQGKADASAVDSLVLDYMRSQNEPFADEVKIIEKLGPAGIPPAIYSSSLPIEQANKIKSALIGMKDSDEGRAILRKAYLKSFVAVDDSLYDGIREWHKMAENADFMEVK